MDIAKIIDYFEGDFFHNCSKFCNLGVSFMVDPIWDMMMRTEWESHNQPAIVYFLFLSIILEIISNDFGAPCTK